MQKSTYQLCSQEQRRNLLANAKPFALSRQTVYEAYRKVRANRGTYGIDNVTLEMFDKDVENNLYKIWNRMSSGSYMPPAVKRVLIPKKGGGERPLGIPTVTDRIAQMVVKMYVEPLCEVMFHENSYAYRPNRSAHAAVAQARKNCFNYSWVIDIDIKSFFDTIDHELLMKAVKRHTREPWILLYIERWLKASVQHEDGTVEIPVRGTPQGSVISPLLANLFLHYAFDKWMDKVVPYCPFERYADDIVVHSSSLMQAQYVKTQIESRFKECGLQLHPEKTKIVYCRYGRSKEPEESHKEKSFDFLGFTFKPRRLGVMKKGLNTYWGFTPAISSKSKKVILDSVRAMNISRKMSMNLSDIAKMINPALRGWINYYGIFRRSELRMVLEYVNYYLCKWFKKKYRIASNVVAVKWLNKTVEKTPKLFAHWELLKCISVRQ
jgi:RNA-directed DNA polymerase